MEPLTITASDDTPEISFDKQTNKFQITGKSLPEDVIEFYSPIFNWLERYVADPNEETFNSRRIAQEAFLAGNDLLILSDYALTESWEDQAANIRSTIAFFQERYASDPSFQALVNEAVARILKLKLSLYGTTPRLSIVQPNATRH